MMSFTEDLAWLPHNAPAPIAEDPIRLFIYQSQGCTNRLEELSDFTIGHIGYRTAEIVAAGPELRWAWGWRLWRRPDARPEDHNFILFRLEHQDYCGLRCWVAGVQYRDDASYYLASRVRLPSKFFNLVAIIAPRQGEVVWAEGEGLNPRWRVRP
jgi:hypothetical protein